MTTTLTNQLQQQEHLVSKDRFGLKWFSERSGLGANTASPTPTAINTDVQNPSARSNNTLCISEEGQFSFHCGSE
jgi:hypothetical protein